MGVVRSRRSVVLQLGSVVFAVVAIAIALALTGRSEAAVTVALFAILLPAPPFIGALFVLIVKSPGWYRSAETFLGVVVCGAAAVFVLAFLIWLPSRRIAGSSRRRPQFFDCRCSRASSRSRSVARSARLSRFRSRGAVVIGNERPSTSSP